MPRLCSLLPALLLAATAAVTVRAQTSLISIPAWIEQDAGTLTPKFQATLNGNPVPVTAQLGPDSDQIILLVFDLTGDLSLIEAAKQAVIAEISKLPPNAWVGLLRDQDGLHVLADPSPHRQRLITAVQSLTSSGQPGLLETVRSALSLADAIIRKSPVRVSVLYITDGSIYNYREDYTNPVINASDPYDLSRRFPGSLIEEKVSKLVEDLSSLQAPLFIVHLNHRQDRLNQVYQNGLETLTSTTGGESDVCRSLAEIPEAISAMFTRISNAWRITLAVPPKIHSTSEIRLSVLGSRGDLRLSWRTHFRPKGR